MDVSTRASWRQLRYRPHEFLQGMVAAGSVISPLLGLPGATLGLIVLDWLHVVDLGVGADVLGNYFWDLIQIGGAVLEGATQEDRLKKLWGVLKEYYKEAKPASQLDHLTKEMIKADKKKPKLRAKGAECRYLVPFAAGFAKKQAGVSLHWQTVAGLLQCLFDLQMMVSGIHQWDYSTACEKCVQMLSLYSALGKEAVREGRDMSWQMKPKVHMLQEMIEYQAAETGNPADFWCYRDESWCGFWAKASARRGGPNLAATTAARFLNRFRALEDLR